MLALVLLACQSEPKTPAAELPVISAYRHYAADNCGAVREDSRGHGDKQGCGRDQRVDGRGADGVRGRDRSQPAAGERP